MSQTRGAVLITGASTGLGRETALRLADRGFLVLAGVRKDTDADDLRQADARIEPVILDVTASESIAVAHKVITERVGEAGLAGLVNNAGVCVAAPIELLSAEDLRAQLEVSLVGPAQLIRTFLPLLRIRDARAGLRAPAGRIVNVASGVGRLATPYHGAYAAAQFGKIGLSDALRRELAPLSISVSIIEPGAVATPIWGKLGEGAERVLAAAPAEIADLYRDRFLAFVTANGQRAQASRTTPAAVADAVEHALTARTPRTRYPVGADSKAVAVATRLLPNRLLDLVMERTSPAVTAPKEVRA
ncbi:SDR family NAD(P)-dependent oxidoreductase [Nocardia huaxiensis]|uniref:SDR family NAD(P)-dependent oxidoreductase n=1 Tax=Nocardia huaxiensis TaxID=2755382 RepID=UPI001E57E09A|nr:SDR family NAD(P)-dependent oxidoreductase [Nocardia huaxiensis]UFS99768.1 SDR family NAD(P)-dependent oxidoreductase [Nocardia huaxiensis]